MNNLRDRLARLERRNTVPDENARIFEEMRNEVDVIKGSIQHRAALAFPFPRIQLRVSSSDEPGPPNGRLAGQDPDKIRSMVVPLFISEGMTPEAAAIEAEKYVDVSNSTAPVNPATKKD